MEFFDLVVCLAAWLVPLVLVGCLVEWRRDGVSWPLLRGAGMVLAASFVVNFSIGVITYANGTATRRGYGLPRRHQRLDPVTRTYWRSEGCGPLMSVELFAHLPHNGAIVLMTSLFGPMPGAYDGPYPTREEAERALAASDVVLTVGDLLDDGVPVPGLREPYSLHALRYGLSGVEWDYDTKLKLAVIEENCLVVGVDAPRRERVILHDGAGARPFAVY